MPARPPARLYCAAVPCCVQLLADNRGRRSYGGVDSVVLWQFYPNGGVGGPCSTYCTHGLSAATMALITSGCWGSDARNQFDMIRSLPGGMPGAQQLVGQARRIKTRCALPCTSAAALSSKAVPVHVPGSSRPSASRCSGPFSRGTRAHARPVLPLSLLLHWPFPPPRLCRSPPFHCLSLTSH